MGKSELFSHFADRFEVKRTQAREFFDELNTLAEKELKRSGEFVIPGMVKLVVQKRKARMGRNPATGEQIKIAGEDRGQGADRQAAEGRRSSRRSSGRHTAEHRRSSGIGWSRQSAFCATVRCRSRASRLSPSAWPPSSRL